MAHDDETLRLFLALLDCDIRDHPERLRPLDVDFVERLKLLVGDIDVDLDAPLPPDAIDDEIRGPLGKRCSGS